MIYAGVARNEAEFNSAIALAASVFHPVDATGSDAVERKRAILCGHGGVAPDATIVLSHPRAGTIGAAFIVDREFVRGGQRIPGAFISTICIDPGFRGKGYSHDLMNAAIEKTSKNGAMVSVVIARRAVDHYYTRFGFWGLSQYSRVKLRTDGPLFRELERGDLRAATDSDLARCANLYESEYRQLFGNCVREAETWRHLVNKFRYLNVAFTVLDVSGDIAGYAVHDDAGNVYEVSASDADAYKGLLGHLATRIGGGAITFHLSPHHHFVRTLADHDVTISGRECVYGGHMIRVNNESELFQLLEHRVKNNAIDNGLGPYAEEHSGIAINWTGSTVSAKKTKLWDGGVAGIARLLGASRATDPMSTAVLDRPMPFNIPLADQI